MKVDPVFLGVVSDLGKLEMPPARRAQMEAYLRSFKGQDVELVIRKHYRRRSVNQNAAWWSLIVPRVTAACDMDPNDAQDCEFVHYGLVEKCFGATFNEKLGVNLPKARSSKLTTEQFSYLMEWTARWAAEEFGIVLTMPSDLQSEPVERRKQPRRTAA